MKYELAKKLKDAGFPRGDQLNTPQPQCFEDEEHQKPIRTPTLLELIEACGKNHPQNNTFEFCLIFSTDVWCSGYMDEDLGTRLPIGKGLTPEEAVANLWLQLNEKNEDSIS